MEYVKSELLNWKFYEMNECDIVAAKSEEDAKKYYEEFVPREEIDQQFLGECDGTFVIGCYIRDLTDQEYKIIESLNPGGKEGIIFYATGLQWLEVSLLIGNREPFIISSTEY